MNISAKTEYACIAALELASHFGGGKPVQIRRIAKTHGIPSRFLVQILLQLKGAGLVASTRGAAGGYRLARNPQQVSLADVMDVVDGKTLELAGNAGVATPASKALLEVWSDADALQREMLRSVSLADLLERIGNRNQNMYYI